MTDDWYRVIGGEHREGAIIVSQFDSAVDYSAMLSGRVANIVPVDSIDKVTDAVTAYTQTIGIYPESLKRELRDKLPLFGAQRLTTLGYACSVPIAAPQDAIEPMRRMCKWIVEEACDPDVVTPLWRLGEAGGAGVMGTAHRTRSGRRCRPDRQDLRDHRCVGRSGARVRPGARRDRRARRSGGAQRRTPLPRPRRGFRRRCPHAKTSTVTLDLTSLASVRTAADADPGHRPRDPRADEQRRGDVHPVRPNPRWLRNPVRHKPSRALRADATAHPAAHRRRWRPDRHPVLRRPPDERRRPRRPELGATRIRQVRRVRRVEDRQRPAHGRARPPAARPTACGPTRCTRASSRPRWPAT